MCLVNNRSFKLERCKLESAAEQGKKSKAQAVQLRRTSEEQFEKERVLVEQLRLDNKSKIDDITHMKVSNYPLHSSGRVPAESQKRLPNHKSILVCAEIVR